MDDKVCCYFFTWKVRSSCGTAKTTNYTVFSFQSMGFSLLNLCFENKSSSLYLLKYFSASYFLSRSMTNFSSQENISIREYFPFLLKTAAAQSLSCLVVIRSMQGNISSDKQLTSFNCTNVWLKLPTTGIFFNIQRRVKCHYKIIRNRVQSCIFIKIVNFFACCGLEIK